MNTDTLLPKLRSLSTELRGAGTNQAMLTAAIAKLDVVINDLTGLEPTTDNGETWAPNDGKANEQPAPADETPTEITPAPADAGTAVADPAQAQ